MQWGDEGKGGVIDAVAGEADLVVRCQGGANAGHTVIVNGKKHKFHLLPCGILRQGVENLIAHGVVLDLEELDEEIQAVRSEGIEPKGRLFISERCHIIFPFHKQLDGLAEKILDSTRRGTSGRGIAPCYSDKVSYLGLRLADLYQPGCLRRSLEKNLAIKAPLLKHAGCEPVDIDAITARYTELAEGVRPLVVDGIEMIHRALERKKRILVEGAQGTLLDVDYGTYPYVSASNSSVHGVSTGSGIPGRKIDEIGGVVKAYCTRVGAETGPFPTIDEGPDGALIRKRGKEYGTTTGRPRQCGWLDLVATRYSTLVNDIDYVILTLLDVLDEFDTIKACVEYEIDGEKTDSFPAACERLMRCTPVYREFPGWKQDISSAKKWDDLPQNARDYVEFIEKFVGKPVKVISVGPDRSQKIFR